MAHIIQTKYDEMKKKFGESALSADLTGLFREINGLCQTEMDKMARLPLESKGTARGKNYVLFSLNGKNSRPVNIDLYKEGREADANGQDKVKVFWDNVLAQTIKNQPARDITAALYVISMNYCCCSDVVQGVKSNGSTFFERLIGHLYARHLNIEPSKRLNAVELDGESISIPTGSQCLTP